MSSPSINQTPRPSESPPVNILLVDDEVRNLDVLESILHSPQYSLVRANTAEKALLALLDGEFAVMVLDIQMPVTNGIELANLIKQRKRTQHIPIIFLTAYFQEDKDVLQGYEVGAVDYLTKPVDPKILRSKVAVFAELFQKTRELAALNNSMELEIAQRQKAEHALRLANQELEARVAERTLKLTRANDDLRASENALRASEKRLTETLSRLPAGVYTCDARGFLTFFNHAAELLWGRTPKLGEELWCGSFRIFNPDGTPLALDKCPMAIALTEGRSVRGHEILIERPDGGRRHVLPYPEPIYDASGQLTGAINVLLDITERKQAEELLKQARDQAVSASRAKDDFLAALSHELRTPLSPVLLLASEAAENTALPEMVRADFTTIRNNVELEARLIDDLLDLTRVSRGILLLNRTAGDVHGVLREAVATVERELKEKEISLRATLAPGECICSSDPVRLRQVFWNVLKNAVKFTPAKGTVSVTTRVVPESRHFEVTISDTGIGMTERELGRVFEAFSQGDHASETAPHRFGGLGLGLAISRKLIELHSGSIEAHSAGRHKGSTFTIRLPLDHPAAKKSPAAGELPSPIRARVAPEKSESLAILVVEDHEPTRTALARLLHQRNYRVETARSLAEARSLADKTKFHLLISDIGLPDGQGYDLMLELGKRLKLKGIALSGYGMECDIERSQSAGFVAHLTKPIRVQSLENALATAFSGEP